MSRSNYGAPVKPSKRGTHRAGGVTAGILATCAIALIVAIAIGATVGGSPDRPAASQPSAQPIEYTGDTNEMGMRVIETPGTAQGAATASSVKVVGATWALGDVPIDVAVRPTWILENTGTTPVSIDEPHAEVIAGCCPGALTVDADELAPGERATVTFELAMHEGMDGWHDMAVHVPVGDDTLTLAVNGYFS